MENKSEKVSLPKGVLIGILVLVLISVIVYIVLTASMSKKQRVDSPSGTTFEYQNTSKLKK